jgi:hypothetical protein
MRTFIIGIFLSLFCSAVMALSGSGHYTQSVWINHAPLSLQYRKQGQIPDRIQILAEATKETTPQSSAPQPESGDLIIPGEDKDQKEKKCLTICKKWGEDCIINPRTGNRDCRRTCKELGEECF